MPGKKAGKRYPYLWAVLYGVFLTGYAVFTLLDAFVLPRDMVYVEDITDTPSIDGAAPEYEDPGQDIGEATVPDLTELREQPQVEEMTEPVITNTSYESAGIAISITTQRKYDTEIYIADVTIKDISYLRAGLAEGVFGRNVSETTSAMAEANEAILAINGDYYGFRDSGFVMRNGYLYRDTARAADDDALVIYEDGHMEIINENDADIQTLAQTAVHIFSFGPGLIREGERRVSDIVYIGE